MGQLRSLKMIPFDSLGMVSCLHSVATMTVSLAIRTQYSNMTAASHLAG